jgi:hypothetical protein
MTGSEELFGVVSTIATPADRFGKRQFEVEGCRLIGGRRRYGAVASASGSGSDRILIF